MREFDFSGTAVITGAASGIGRELARALAGRGMNLVLLDRDSAGLADTSSIVSTQCPRSTVSLFTVDLSDRAATRELGDKLAVEFTELSLLVNNAGVAMTGAFEQISEEEFDWLIDINLGAPILLTRALLPRLLSNPGSHIVNVSSVFGLVAPAQNIPYVTSKFGIRGFTEGLRAELAGTEVGVTCVHPGGIKTNIARQARIGSLMTTEEAAAARRASLEFESILTISVETAASTIMDGVARRRPRVLIGASAKIPDLVARIFPSNYHKVIDVVEAASSAFTRITTMLSNTRLSNSETPSDATVGAPR